MVEKVKSGSALRHFIYLFICRLVMQPEIENGSSYGHVEIDVVKDENVKGWPKIVLDINNITITKAQGECTASS